MCRVFWLADYILVCSFRSQPYPLCSLERGERRKREKGEREGDKGHRRGRRETEEGDERQRVGRREKRTPFPHPHPCMHVWGWLGVFECMCECMRTAFVLAVSHCVFNFHWLQDNHPPTIPQTITPWTITPPPRQSPPIPNIWCGGWGVGACPPTWGWLS